MTKRTFTSLTVVYYTMDQAVQRLSEETYKQDKVKFCSHCSFNFNISVTASYQHGTSNLGLGPCGHALGPPSSELLRPWDHRLEAEYPRGE